MNDQFQDILKSMQEQMRQQAEEDKKDGTADPDNPIDPEMYTKYDASDPLQALQFSQDVFNKTLNKKKPTIWKRTQNILDTLLSLYNWWWGLLMILFIVIYMGKSWRKLLKGDKEAVLNEGNKFHQFSKSLRKYRWIIKPIVTALSTYYYYTKFYL